MSSIPKESANLEAWLDWAQQSLNQSLKEPLLDASDYRLEAEILLAELLERNRTWLKVWPEHILEQAQQKAYIELIKRRAQGEPVAYILGHKEFWSLKFKVSPDTLIPRPDTEVLVETALELLLPIKQPKLVDLGTGTGAIAIALATERPDGDFFALDFSPQALEIAEFNRQNLQVNNLKCLRGDWLRDWQGGALDMIVSNPPYIAPNDPHLDSLTYEPYQALVAENRGFADYQTIITQALKHLKPDGWVVFEHGIEQAPELSVILAENGFESIATRKDYAGIPRVTFAQLNPKAD